MDDELLNWLRIQIYTARFSASEALKHWPPGDEIAGQVESIEAGAFIHRNNPYAVLAQCEAHTAILDEHWNVNEGDCCTCVTGEWGYPTHGGSSPQAFPCKTVRIIAMAYRHNEGYQEEWRP